MKQQIKPVGVINVSKTSKAHIPDLIRRETGRVHSIPFMIGARTVLLYDPALPPEALLDSIEILKRTIRIHCFSKTPRTGASEGDVRSVAGEAVEATLNE
jgi:hypothetical protein